MKTTTHSPLYTYLQPTYPYLPITSTYLKMYKRVYLYGLVHMECALWHIVSATNAKAY